MNRSITSLTNVLIPRSQFLSSVLGQAILNNSTLPARHNASTAVDQISGLTLSQLACYWQNLAIAPGQFPTSNTCSSGGGTPHGINPGTPYAVTVTADPENCTQNLNTSTNCQAGGVPSAPALSTGCSGCPAPAVQAVVTLNLSSDANLTYLLAGLLDNNTTVASGQLGVNGHFVNITGQMLHLHPHDLFSFFAGLWNSFSGVVAALLTHLATRIQALVGVAWNDLVAAVAYFDHIREGLAHLVANTVNWVVDTTVAGLKHIGTVLVQYLQALLAFVEAQILRVLTAPIDLAISGLKTSLQGLQGTIDNWAQQVDLAYEVGSPPLTPSSGAKILAYTFAIGAAITILLQIAVGVAIGVSLGAGFLISTLIVVIIDAVIKAGGSLSKPGSGPLSQVAGIVTAGAATGFRTLIGLIEDAFGSLENPLKASDIQPLGQTGSEDFWLYAAFSAVAGFLGSFFAYGYAANVESGGGYAAAEAGAFMAFSALMFIIEELFLLLVIPAQCNSSDIGEYNGLQFLVLIGTVFAGFGETASLFGLLSTKDADVRTTSGIAAIGGLLGVVFGSLDIATLHNDCAGV